MPTWVGTVIATAAVLAAAGTIWRMFVQPMAALIVLQRQALPLLRSLSKVFGDVPTPFDVLGEIVAEFRTDSGSSLRDVVNRLDSAALENRSAAEVLKVQVEASRLLAVDDREQLQRLLLVLDRLTVKVETNSTERAIESERVRDNLTVAQTAVNEVAQDLSDAHDRADATKGAPGMAADAASQRP